MLALTGIDTDRLKEEKRRGITIELGFAHLDLGQDPHKIRLGLVDVPGHERFLRAMVAGAGGVDLVILVIAADEGVMPQTREHLAICELLGARRGVIALTKADRVEREWLDLVAADVSQTAAGTFLAGARLIPCSLRRAAPAPASMTCVPSWRGWRASSRRARPRARFASRSTACSR